MAIDRANDRRAFRGFIDEQLAHDGADMTLEEALTRWEVRECSGGGEGRDPPGHSTRPGGHGRRADRRRLFVRRADVAESGYALAHEISAATGPADRDSIRRLWQRICLPAGGRSSRGVTERTLNGLEMGS